MTDLVTTPAGGLDTRLEAHRRELTGYCYRMLGSAFDAEDAVQETLVRAWRSIDRFEERSSLRTWLYRIATNVCLDALSGAKRRARPVDLGPAQTPESTLRPGLPDEAWLGPAPDERMLDLTADPADLAVARESVRLAFVAALQHLPPRQRAVLIFREVLRWQASEVAELLDTSVPSVNSALQRARATLAQHQDDGPEAAVMGDEEAALLARYVEAFEAYDLDALTAVLAEDASMNMPPFELWLRSREHVLAWFVGQGAACRGSRIIPTVANGQPALGQYKPDHSGSPESLRWSPWSLQVLDVSDGRVTGITAFLDTARLFPLFGLPPHLDA